MNPYLVQAIGIAAMVFNILSYQHKNQKMVILFQLTGATLFAVHFAFLGAVVGAILNAVAVFRAIVFLFRERLHTDHIAWTIAFEIIFVASYILTFKVFDKEPTVWNFILEFLPVIGMTALTLAYRCKDAKAIRRYGLISSPAWLIYNIANFSIGAICCEAISLISIVVGMIRHDRKKPSENA